MNKMNQINKMYELVDLLEEVANMNCLRRDGKLDSNGISTYAEILEILADHGRVKIEYNYGRRIIAKPKQEG